MGPQYVPELREKGVLHLRKARNDCGARGEREVDPRLRTADFVQWQEFEQGSVQSGADLLIGSGDRRRRNAGRAVHDPCSDVFEGHHQHLVFVVAVVLDGADGHPGCRRDLPDADAVQSLGGGEVDQCIQQALTGGNGHRVSVAQPYTVVSYECMVRLMSLTRASVAPPSPPVHARLWSAVAQLGGRRSVRLLLVAWGLIDLLLVAIGGHHLPFSASALADPPTRIAVLTANAMIVEVLAMLLLVHALTRRRARLDVAARVPARPVALHETLLMVVYGIAAMAGGAALGHVLGWHAFGFHLEGMVLRTTPQVVPAEALLGRRTTPSPMPWSHSLCSAIGIRHRRWDYARPTVGLTAD